MDDYSGGEHAEKASEPSRMTGLPPRHCGFHRSDDPNPVAFPEKRTVHRHQIRRSTGFTRRVDAPLNLGDDLSKLDIRVMASDKAGRLWIGIYGLGLVEWDEGCVRVIGRADELSNPCILSLPDKDAVRGSEQRIGRFRPRERTDRNLPENTTAPNLFIMAFLKDSKEMSGWRPTAAASLAG
ncbi:MAG: hypothetical protein MZV63_30820 [Marinilabiliales bacterium]|nr:hypothetical protein [Marinilabiliales bacterium]